MRHFYTENMDAVFVLFAVLMVILGVLFSILRSLDRAELQQPHPSLLLPIWARSEDRDR